MAKKKTKKKKAEKPKQSQPAKPVSKQDVTPHPTGGRAVKEFEDLLDQQIAEADQLADSKPKRGRPRKPAEPVPQPAIDLSSGLIQQAIKVPFHLWSISQDISELKLLDSEAAALTGPVKQLLDHYAPQLPPIAVAWFSLAVTGYSIMSVRLQILAEVRKQKKTKSPPPESTGGIQGDGPPPPAGPKEDGTITEYENTGPSGFPIVRT